VNTSPRLDEQVLITLRDVMGDDFSLLIETYISDAEVRLNALAASIAQRDADTLRRAAHSFKGSSFNIGALRLGAYCDEMEALALAGDSAHWEQQLKRIQEEYMEVEKLLHL
jgi:HPt (histidine-containing phosphotransfer) domain-containing protein